MKKLLLLLPMILFISACEQGIKESEITWAYSVCENNEGVTLISIGFDTVQVRCKNTATFKKNRKNIEL